MDFGVAPDRQSVTLSSTMDVLPVLLCELAPNNGTRSSGGPMAPIWGKHVAGAHGAGDAVYVLPVIGKYLFFRVSQHAKQGESARWGKKPNQEHETSPIAQSSFMCTYEAIGVHDC